MEGGGGKYRRRSSEKRIGVFTDSGNAGYLGGGGARLPPLCGARIEAIAGNGLKAAVAEDNKRHVIVKAKKKKRPSIPNLEAVSGGEVDSSVILNCGQVIATYRVTTQVGSIVDTKTNVAV